MPRIQSILSMMFIAMGLALAGCIVPGTTITIDSPANGSTIERNKEIQVVVTATDAIGVTRVELWDAGVVILTARSTLTEGQSVFAVNFAWTPRDAGSHVLVAKAYNRESSEKESALAVLTLQVAEGVTPTPTRTPSTPTLTPTTGASPTATRSSTPGPSPTPTISSTPTLSPTPTTPPTGTPPPIPTAPSNLAATGAGTTIQFAWADNSTVELGFRIYEQGSVAPIADNIPAHVSTGGMAFELKNLPCNKNAAYTVKAFNAQGESPASNSANAITVPCPPSNLAVSAASSTNINLSFTNNATTETGYRVYRTESATPLGAITAPPGQGPKSGSLGGLPCGTTYAYYVRAFNAAGESSNSNTSEVTTSGCTVTITFTQIHVISGGDNEVAGCGGVVPRLDCGAGDVWLDFVVNTQAKRWPAASMIEINSGETKPITEVSYTFTLVRGQNLSINVNGTDQDSLTGNDQLGTVIKTYTGAENWGAGTHTEKSSCPSGCYDVTFIVEVKN